MGYLLSEIPIASLVPSGTLVSVIDAIAGDESPEVAEEFTAGMIAGLTGSLNAHSARLDAMARALGCYGILTGCVISIVSSTLNVAISDGYAAIDGLVEVNGVAPYTLPASTSRCWLWLKQDGTLTHTTSSTPPVGKVVYVGSAVTSGSVVTSVNVTDGIVKFIGGVPTIQTDDVLIPSASPSASVRLFCKTQKGTFFWDGTVWVLMLAGLSHPQLTSTQRDALTPVAGMTIYNTTTNKVNTYDGSTWQAHW